MVIIIEGSGNNLNRNASERMQMGLVRRVLEKISRELSPQYTGELFVERYIGELESMTDSTYLYIEEQTPGKKILGIFPKTERKTIFAIMEGFYQGGRGGRAIRVLLNDNKAEPVIKKHLNLYIQEASVNEVYMQRGF